MSSNVRICQTENQTMSESYIDKNKSKHFINPTDILKSAKNLYEKFYTKEATSKAATTEFLSKVPNWKKKSNEQFNFYEPKISLDVVAKFKNYQTNDKFPGNDGQTEEIYKHFSNALAPAL